MSRYLIRPMVSCRLLASDALGRILRRLPIDFEQRYGYRPYWVESFADEGDADTCLRAANFLSIGRTAGRGRQDRKKEQAKTVKKIFMYALDPNWRRKLKVPYVDHAPSLVIGAGLASNEWAANELGGAPLGDERRAARLVKSTGLLADYPGQKISAASDSGQNEIVGFYRLIEAPVESAVTVPNILAPHRERTIQRMRGQRTVLAIQDGTDLNVARRPGCDDLQFIGKNQTKSTTLGLHLHATLAVNAAGLPLGVLAAGFDPNKTLSNAEYQRRKTARWFEAFDDIGAAVREVSGKTRVISVCDREADMFELFDQQRQCPRVDLIVRARHDRVLVRGNKQSQKLFATMSSGAADGLLTVAIEGLTARPKTGRKLARPKRQKRTSSCELRFRAIKRPATDAVAGAKPLRVHAVHIKEISPPEDEEPVQWYLLTTLPLKTLVDAKEIVEFYLKRWRIEDFFRILKSGCRVEFLLFRTADRLQRAIAINLVIAWRIMLMTLLGREVADYEPGLMFTDEELA